MIKWHDGLLVVHLLPRWNWERSLRSNRGIFPLFTYASLSHLSSPCPYALMQSSQKHAYFLVSIENISPMYLLCIECNSCVPSIIVRYQGMDLFTSLSSNFKNNLCTYFIFSLPSWPKWNLHELTTSFDDLSWYASWLIWYLLSSHFTQESAPSCSPFPCHVSKNIQVCWIFVSLWSWLNQ